MIRACRHSNSPKGSAKPTKQKPSATAEPVNPLTGSSKVITDSKQANATAGWWYNPANGELKAVVSRQDYQNLKFSAADAVVY